MNKGVAKDTRAGEPETTAQALILIYLYGTDLPPTAGMPKTNRIPAAKK
jgi:hypothetical protein